MSLLQLVILQLYECCAGFLPAAITESDPPAALYSSCSSCIEVSPNADEETALATEKFRRVDSDVFPAVSAENNRVVSSDPTLVGYISSVV